MDSFTEDTPLGPITISEEDGKIISLSFRGDGMNDTCKTPAIEKAFSQLNEYFNGERRTFDLEYAPKGTEFQKRVWSCLQKIPYGRTVSYRELAEMTGSPNAQRAVGNANGKNPVAIFIPCHRVIRSDGTIGGYSCGIDIKEKLLELEGIL